MPNLFNLNHIKAHMAASAPKEKIRCEVFLDTILHLEDKANNQKILQEAERNLKWWKLKTAKPAKKAACTIEVLPGDWGTVTRALTEKHGQIFAVLNMANAYAPGGGVDHGMIAQEENMYRRTNCYQSILAAEVNVTKTGLRYKPEKTQLINGEQGEVYLDTDNIRVCYKGPETKDIQNGKLGYKRLADQEIFPFYELRSAAMDCRSLAFDAQITRKKIQAQLNTLKKKGVRHAVLSAFGCGAFLNPPEVVAKIYQEEIAKMKDDFDHIAFAVYYPGYGPKQNFEVFEKILAPREKPAPQPDPSSLTPTPNPDKHFLARHWGKLLLLALGVTAIILAGTVLSSGLMIAFLVLGSLASSGGILGFLLPKAEEPAAVVVPPVSAAAKAVLAAPVNPLKRSVSFSKLPQPGLFGPKLKRAQSSGGMEEGGGKKLGKQ